MTAVIINPRTKSTRAHVILTSSDWEKIKVLIGRDAKNRERARCNHTKKNGHKVLKALVRDPEPISVTYEEVDVSRMTDYEKEQIIARGSTQISPKKDSSSGESEIPSSLETSTELDQVDIPPT